MEANDELMTIFRKISNDNESVTLLNTYRGFPINYPATIVAVDRGMVGLSVHPHQAVCMALEGKTYLQSQRLLQTYRANVVGADVPKQRVALMEFVESGNKVGLRTAIRVHPNEPIDAEIYDGRRRIGGKIADISSTGVGVCTFASYIYGDLSFEKEKEVYVAFRLPNTETIVRFNGTVTNVVDQEGTFLHRLGIRIFPNPEVEPLLLSYIQQREKETLGELQLIFESMCKDKAG